MINFRYHVVSLTAVFLALAIGLIVGTSALNGPLSDSLRHQVDSLSKSNDIYRDKTIQLEAEVSQREQFATEVAPLVLGGKLTDRRVLVVSFQESDSYVADVIADLKKANAKITGQIEIQDSMMGPSSGPTLLELEHQANLPINVQNIPTFSDGVETATALLAAVLTDRSPAVSDTAAQTVLQAYEDSGFVKVSGKVTSPAEAIVVLAPTPYTDQNAADENKNVVTLIDQFTQDRPNVVGAAGNAGKGNVIGSITGDASLSSRVSTVDNANTPQGAIATVLALTEQVVYNRVGHYGITSSANSLLPVLPSTS